MLDAIRVVAIALVGSHLCACERRTPDSVLEIVSPDNLYRAKIEFFQPRGTIEGYALLTFNGDLRQVSSFHHLKGARFGWSDEREFSVIGDIVTYTRIRSDFYLGNNGEGIKLLVCIRTKMQCMNLESKLNSKEAHETILQFPDGDWDSYL